MTAERLPEEVMVMRAAREFRDGMVINLGYGMPTHCASYIPEDLDVLLHAENGLIDFGKVLEREQGDLTLLDAGGQPVSPRPGMAIVDHAESFALVRGGRIDIAVLGAYQVSERGDLANWRSPDRDVPGTVGGAMDLAICARKVIALMTHTARGNRPKLVKRCSVPLTALACVDLIITDLAVMEVTAQGVLLKEIAPGWPVEEVQGLTEPSLRIATDLKPIAL